MEVLIFCLWNVIAIFICDLFYFICFMKGALVINVYYIFASRYQVLNNLEGGIKFYLSNTQGQAGTLISVNPMDGEELNIDLAYFFKKTLYSQCFYSSRKRASSI